MSQSAIHWTSPTWNVVRGCKRGCANCFVMHKVYGTHKRYGSTDDGAVADDDVHVTEGNEEEQACGDHHRQRRRVRGGHR